MPSAPLRCVALLVLATLSGCSSDGSSNGEEAVGEEMAAALLGTWKSKDCEPSGATGSRRRTYVFTPSDVKITYELFAGTQCETGPRILTATTHGDAAFVGKSSALPGVTNVLFTFKSRAITPAAAGVDLLKGTCGQYPWAADEEVDVSQDGCKALVQSNTECPVEYDLADIVDGVAYFGDRSVPLCSEGARPAQLAEWGVAQQP
ncbi:hypothetical protein POL68_32155 [Stigmatella sp. ncwal1]|uniref:APCDD1 domain-containing protein n=1 Tax=Stigmatella ashevillensis TaxID=2995309 RepID=A0ABT5DHL8_9BACT|nr:hypothetical protein [Stigmatella ashevillena]MDC0713159.1 hypothetical protein [Stigmatella ashevillena]